MNEVYPLQLSRQNLPGAVSDESDHRERGVVPRSFEDLVHELRQPLSTIESLAYYLELTESSPHNSRHLRLIRAMVLKAHNILSEGLAS